MIECIVIGAGPGGLVCTKELLENGIVNIVCLEQSDRLGGVFAKSYDGLHLTSSATFSMFSDFWVGDGNDHVFWTKDEVVDYWTRYCEHYGVNNKIRFGARVDKVVSSEDQSWAVHLDSGEVLQTKRLALAAGNNSVPRLPEWKNELEIEYLHSMNYRNAEAYRGKRVLVVGGGESGSDIALEISKVAAQTWVSLRESTGWVVPRLRRGRAADISTHRGLWDLPREYGARISSKFLEKERTSGDPILEVVAELNSRVRSRNGIWGTFGTKTISLPEAIAHHGCKVVGDIAQVREGGRQLVTADDQTLKDVDAVVFCTGYINRLPFLPEEIQACDPRSLYKHMFDIDLKDRLAWIGWARPGFGSQFPIMELQARLFGLICAGRHQLPDAAEMERVACADRHGYLQQLENNAYRIRSLVDYHRYMDDIARLIGCRPPIKKFFFTNPRIWLHIMYGPTQATQFRLTGPGAKYELAKKILFKLPVAGFNHVVKAGLSGRLRYALKALIPWGLQNRPNMARLSEWRLNRQRI